MSDGGRWSDSRPRCVSKTILQVVYKIRRTPFNQLNLLSYFTWCGVGVYQDKMNPYSSFAATIACDGSRFCCKMMWILTSKRICLANPTNMPLSDQGTSPRNAHPCLCAHSFTLV